MTFVPIVTSYKPSISDGFMESIFNEGNDWDIDFRIACSSALTIDIPMKNNVQDENKIFFNLFIFILDKLTKELCGL